MKDIKFCAALRTTAWICLYFALLSFFRVFAPWRIAMAVLAAAFFVLGMVIVRIDSPVLRLLISLLPGAAFLLGPADIHIVFPLFGQICFIIAMAAGNFDLHIDNFRRGFTLGLICAAAVLVVGITDTMINNMRFMRADAVIYVSAFFLLYMFATRSMQMGRTYMSAKMRALTSLSVIGLPLVIVGAAILVGLLFEASTPFLAALFAPLIRFLISLSVTIFPQDGPPDVTIQPATTVRPRFALYGYGFEGSSTGMRYEEIKDDTTSLHPIQSSTSVGMYIVIAFLIAAFIFLLIQFLRRPRMAEGDPIPVVEEKIEKLPFEGVFRRRRAEPVPSNVKHVRKTYRSYLRFIKSLSMKVSASDTSQDVLDTSCVLPDRPENERLRELYIAARYGDPDAVTEEQSAEARKCFDIIRADTESQLDRTPSQYG